MNKDSNKYIYIYSIALVVIVAAALSVAATLLKPFQQKNVEVEKKQSILLSVHKAADVKKAKNKKQYIENEYAKYITDSYVVSSLGAKQEGDAFEVSLEEEASKPAANRKLPVFICSDDDGKPKYVIPVRGAGLWGPIWGYVALHDDFSTIYGVVFDHQGETPGLGAELSTPEFQQQFAGKQIFDAASMFTSVKVVKGGNTKGRQHEVDAISGGTITSQGVEKMLLDNLNAYLLFFKEQQRIQSAQQRLKEKEEDERALREQQAEAAKRERRPAPVAAVPPPVDEGEAAPEPSDGHSQLVASPATDSAAAPKEEEEAANAALQKDAADVAPAEESENTPVQQTENL
ncbi:MAG: NADH:ubiquinone reductase (Na(+)-transporting) subunit C [Prevotellaceae bacterium]|jgi:Na+-transporting NADH:ubiquinone oxidoreductase subunit C|nr:NADH:ubiquinone reductase (Na(+)-transporting) subunit C [Prevotellaceae bacterium]